jgi:hypothetical protein
MELNRFVTVDWAERETNEFAWPMKPLQRERALNCAATGHAGHLETRADTNGPARGRYSPYNCQPRASAKQSAHLNLIVDPHDSGDALATIEAELLLMKSMHAAAQRDNPAARFDG